MMPDPHTSRRASAAQRGVLACAPICALICVLCCILGMGLFAPPPALGAAAGTVTPMPEARPLMPMPPKAVETRRMMHPGLIKSTAVRQDMAHLLFPHDGAMFPHYGTITLGWMPPTEEVLVDLARNSPVAYEVQVTREGAWNTTIRVPVQVPRDVFSGLVSPPGPGRYQWQVFSIMGDGRRISSQNRVFTVLP